MKLIVRIALASAASLALALGAAAQDTKSAQDSKSSGGEKTVEEAYLQESAETATIKELASADDKDSKLLSLLYAKKAMDGGRKNDEIRNTLQTLALESTQVVTRSGGLGPAINNYPDIRRTACEYLGDFPSAEAKDTLITVLKGNRTEDPMVIAEAVRSLGKIGMNDNDEVVQTIAQTINHYSDLGVAEDRFAVYCLWAIDALIEKNGGVRDMRTVTSAVMKFTKGSYVGTVKRMALATLDKLSQVQTKSASSASSNSSTSSNSSSTTTTKK
jgi:hypothetical protein